MKLAGGRAEVQTQAVGFQSPHSCPWCDVQSVWVSITSVIEWQQVVVAPQGDSVSLSGRCAAYAFLSSPILFLELNVFKNSLICYALTILFRLFPTMKELLNSWFFFFFYRSALIFFKPGISTDHTFKEKVSLTALAQWTHFIEAWPCNVLDWLCCFYMFQVHGLLHHWAEVTEGGEKVDARHAGNSSAWNGFGCLIGTCITSWSPSLDFW